MIGDDDGDKIAQNHDEDEDQDGDEELVPTMNFPHHLFLGVLGDPLFELEHVDGRNDDVGEDVDSASCVGDRHDEVTAQAEGTHDEEHQEKRCQGAHDAHQGPPQ